MTFDLDSTTPETDISTVDGLMQELQNQAALLIAVATGGPRIQTVEAEYQRRRQQLMRALERRSLQYPFPWHNLQLWYGHWSANLPDYASRRTHISQLVGPVLEALERQQSDLTVVDPQSKESTCQERITLTMPEQEETDVIRVEEAEEVARWQKGFSLLPEHPETSTSFNARQAAALQDLEDLLLRFYKVARHFAKPNRSGNRLPIQIEADLQYMLYGMLICNFDDVRPEDFAPYRAGSRSRIDFLLEEEKIAIETKVTRLGMNDKEVGNQLIIDFERYQSAPDCQIVVCYVYDPQGFIQNPRALKKDLEKTKREIKVKVIIYQP